MADAPPAQPPSPPVPPAAVHPLRLPAFRAYWLARLAITLGQNAMVLIIGWEAYGLARATMAPAAAAARLGLIGLLQFLPLFLSTPVTGWVADRFDRRHIMRATIALQFLCAAGLTVAASAGALTLHLLFAAAVALGFARAFSGPATSALAPNLVPRAMLPAAIAVSSISQQVGTVVGPALGGWAYAVRPAGAYGLAAALFALAVAAVLTIPPVPRPPAATRRPLRQIADGFAYVATNRLVLGTITLDLFAVFLAGTDALLPVFARDLLHVGPQGLSALAAAPAAGAALTAVVFSVRPLRTNVGPKMLGAVLVYGAATILFGLSRSLPLSLAALAVAGAADMFSVYIRSSLIQLYTPDGMRGRVGAVSQLTISASNELGQAESGFLASALGPVGAVLVGGGGAIVVTLLWVVLFPSLRRARRFEPPPGLA